MITNSKIFVQTKGSNPVVCAREGGANTNPFQAAHFVLRNTPQNGGEKEAGKGGAEFPPDPPSAPPALRSRAWGGKRLRSLGIKTSKQNNFQFLLRKIWRAGVKKLKENCFALLAEFRRAETQGGFLPFTAEIVAQKRFELRSVIAEFFNFNFFDFNHVFIFPSENNAALSTSTETLPSSMRVFLRRPITSSDTFWVPNSFKN